MRRADASGVAGANGAVRRKLGASVTRVGPANRWRRNAVSDGPAVPQPTTLRHDLNRQISHIASILMAPLGELKLAFVFCGGCYASRSPMAAKQTTCTSFQQLPGTGTRFTSSGYTLNKKFKTSPSCTTYSLPSARILPCSFAPCSPLNWMKSAKAMVCARMKPFSKSV